MSESPVGSAGPGRGVSVGLGLTNACNLECAHCYRPDPPLSYLSLEQVRSVCDAVDAGGVNLGTGENILHPEFREILDELFGRGLRVSLTSNGHGICELPDDVLLRLHDAEVSIDFADEERFDAFRGPGAWQVVWKALRRLAGLGVPTTALAVLMRANHRELSKLAQLVGELGVPLRVNLYQPVKTDAFTPTYDELWWAVADLLDHTTLLGCSEPVIRAAAGLPGTGLRCGKSSLRITPQATLLPCVYWPEQAGTLADVVAQGERVFHSEAFLALDQLPDACRECEWLEPCGGGCASRRRLNGGLDDRDPYCPKKGDVDLRGRVRTGEDGGRLHVGNVCTLLVRA